MKPRYGHERLQNLVAGTALRPKSSVSCKKSETRRFEKSRIAITSTRRAQELVVKLTLNVSSFNANTVLEDRERVGHDLAD